MQSIIQRESDDGQTWHIPRHPPKGNTACVSQSGLNSCRDISLTTEDASSALIIRRRSRWGPPITRSRPSVHQRTAPTTPTSDPLLTGTPHERVLRSGVATYTADTSRGARGFKCFRIAAPHFYLF
ncbi:hypothetical protein B296_00026134 [Ensete ventricosum]|uniref:Uncharacterized protein n=1 Tax=Ensete ventricosum TaxID=4639 RepID=A0A426ZVL8_ENSVE|nr:hypothetical protein B296_00026134 [Ensete ventricosum]